MIINDKPKLLISIIDMEGFKHFRSIEINNELKWENYKLKADNTSLLSLEIIEENIQLNFSDSDRINPLALMDNEKVKRKYIYQGNSIFSSRRSHKGSYFINYRKPLLSEFISILSKKIEPVLEAHFHGEKRIRLVLNLKDLAQETIKNLKGKNTKFQEPRIRRASQKEIDDFFKPYE